LSSPKSVVLNDVVEPHPLDELALAREAIELHAEVLEVGTDAVEHERDPARAE
jgi:hypothetical protein